MSVLQRTIRITLSALFANIVAFWIGLENPYATGIIAILAALNTRKETIDRVKEYSLSTITAFAIATVVFLIFDFSYYSFAVYLALYVPAAHYLEVDAGIAPCSVLVTHFLIAGSVSLEWQINGLSIMAIGLFFALIANSWIPSYSKEINYLIDAIEKQMSLILFLIEKQLLEGKEKQSRVETELNDLCTKIDRLEELALIEYENRQSSDDNKEYYIRYGQMRRRQHEILERMNEDLSQVIPNTPENRILASMFSETAEQLDESNTGVELLTKISDLYRVYRDSELPKSRKEFESRAILYNVLNDFEKFLALKRDFYLKFGEETKKLVENEDTDN